MECAVHETLVGTWFKGKGNLREKVVLMTKVELSTDLHAPLSRANLFNQTRDILQRIGLSYIDILQIDKTDINTPMEETNK
jgi:aryl-alcohol dehydrogenase-like predicted oxidoreductase